MFEGLKMRFQGVMGKGSASLRVAMQVLQWSRVLQGCGKVLGCLVYKFRFYL